MGTETPIVSCSIHSDGHYVLDVLPSLLSILVAFINHFCVIFGCHQICKSQFRFEAFCIKLSFVS